jgi:galactose oxidase-like protein/Kelch motif protein
MNRVLRSVRSCLGEQMEFNRLGRKPPELLWKTCARCPEPRTEAAAKKIGPECFVIGGYRTIDSVLSRVDVFDLDKRRWTESFAMPSDMPQTHLGIANDDRRYLYFMGGQLGPQCSPAVAGGFVLDAQKREWTRLPPLPEARYSLSTQLWRGRLHVLSGSKPDRHTPACEHWSLAVEDGKALEDRWREEIPIPRGGPHRGSTILNDRLYVLGGEEGDVAPIPGDPHYTCDWNTPAEISYGDSFVLEYGAKQWKSIAPMLHARTHTEHSIVKIGQHIVLIGGIADRYTYDDVIQVYDVEADRWRMAGRLPYAMKTSAVHHEGLLFVLTGQRSRSPEDRKPGEVLRSVWQVKFDPAQ